MKFGPLLEILQVALYHLVIVQIMFLVIMDTIAILILNLVRHRLHSIQILQNLPSHIMESILGLNFYLLTNGTMVCQYYLPKTIYKDMLIVTICKMLLVNISVDVLFMIIEI
jgi:hypothetical protein